MKRERLSALSRATKRTTQDLRERPSSRFDNDDSHLTKAFQRFAAEHVLPLVTIPGYKQDAKRTAIMQMVQQLLLTGRAEHCVADSRDKSDSRFVCLGATPRTVHARRDIVQAIRRRLRPCDDEDSLC